MSEGVPARRGAGATGRFLHDDVLLSNATARRLFHDVAASQPVVDVHTHLPARDIARDRVYETLAELWLDDDHYKWRAMRTAGVDEQLVSGDADPWDRFAAWARTVPRLLHNPLYLWTHLELRRVFGIDVALSPATAREIWDEANRQLPACSARRLLVRFTVAVLATTDDPGDDLAPHRTVAAELGTGGAVPVVPTWRPDAAHRLLDDPAAWGSWADRLGGRVGVAIEDLESLTEALGRSYGHFVDAGGRASDHGLDAVPDDPRDGARADAALRRVRNGGRASADERAALTSEVLHLAGRLAHVYGCVLQLHLGARRDVSPRLHAALGPDAGADAIGDGRQAPGLARFLGSLEAEGILPRVVLYNANPADNALFAAMAGAFSLPGVDGAVQWGPPWWFNDHEGGIRRQLEELGRVGQLAGFMGMVADARSMLSMTRHEVFRRVLCDVIGREVEAGLYPADTDRLADMVRAVCGGNAAGLFGLPPPAAVPWR
ncbi:MAG TPA: glucuronate isomerase [Acidimicrobiales bacterium]|nr:glucuronate isomerase [Acidimicrobiales bacterium]